VNPALRRAVLGTAIVCLSRPALAAEPPPPCEVALSRETLVPCVLARSPALREELASQRAAGARREAATPVLPANPVLGGTLSSRSTAAQQALNWSLTLAQELEVAGQRGLRLDVAEAELRAQGWRVAVARAAVAEEAWTAYFHALAARDREALATRLAAAVAGVAATARGMASTGLASELEADLADAAATRVVAELVDSRTQVAVTRARLAALAGGPVMVEGPLEPLASAASVAQATALRGELLVLESLRGAVQGRVDLVRRTRVPNPTVSLFAQRDGFNEQVLGGGLSFPIPLPQPVGRTLAGELLEAEALAERLEAELERVRRELEAERAIAAAQYDDGLARLALYTPERLDRATRRLDAIGFQLQAARLPVREALVAQQALIEQLRAGLDAREALCLASVRLTRAAGLALEGDAP
jgi:cobalt-zinc-cadmium efflux system outer membrane protein